MGWDPRITRESPQWSDQQAAVGGYYIASSQTQMQVVQRIERSTFQPVVVTVASLVVGCFEVEEKPTVSRGQICFKFAEREPGAWAEQFNGHWLKTPAGGVWSWYGTSSPDLSC